MKFSVVYREVFPKKTTSKFRVPECPQRISREHLHPQQIGGPAQQQQETQQAQNLLHLEPKLGAPDHFAVQSSTAHPTESFCRTQSQVLRKISDVKFIFRTRRHLLGQEQSQHPISPALNFSHRPHQISTLLTTTTQSTPPSPTYQVQTTSRANP